MWTHGRCCFSLLMLEFGCTASCVQVMNACILVPSGRECKNGYSMSVLVPSMSVMSLIN